MSIERYESDRVLFLDEDNILRDVVYQKPGKRRKKKKKSPVAAFFTKHYLGNGRIGNSFFWNFGFWTLTVIFLEVALQLMSVGEVTGRIVYPILFAIPTGLLLSYLTSFFKPLVNHIISMVLCLGLGVYYNIQLVFHSIFGDFLSLGDMGTGGDALENFGEQTMYGISQIIPQILLLFIPLLVSILLTIFKPVRFTRLAWSAKGINLVAVALLHLLCLAALLLGGREAYTAYDCYYNPDTATNNSITTLGVVTTTRLELKGNLFGSSVESPDDIVNVDPNGLVNPGKQDEQPNVDTSPNVMDIDFAGLAATEKDRTLKELDAYFASQTPSCKNQYTGYFKDYNLIALCAESFSSRLIDPELTPALYELSHNGFVFNNFYNCYNSNTTNGEYTFNMGIFPDLSRSKANGSFRASANNSVPFCLGNMFKTAGIEQRYAYHNYYGSYYSRNLSHPNMGYTFKTPGRGLNIRVSWPSSDLDMMKKSVSDYLTPSETTGAVEQFVAYYMTFSGHYQYNWNNPMCKKNKAEIDEYCRQHGLNYGDTVKAYLSCNLELEKAMAYLLEQLKAAGVAEKTVIVLTNDHYPYGLTAAQFNELAGEKIDTTFGKYQNSFICWCGGMQNPITVDTPCCSIDILPTLLNLFGFEYDSRLLMGRDVLDPASFHIAILSNQSWITDRARFDASRNKLTNLDESDPVTDEYVETIKTIVKNKFNISTKILNKNYYKHVVG